MPEAKKSYRVWCDKCILERERHQRLEYEDKRRRRTAEARLKRLDNTHQLVKSTGNLVE
jgi:hypothetical protein